MYFLLTLFFTKLRPINIVSFYDFVVSEALTNLIEIIVRLFQNLNVLCVNVGHGCNNKGQIFMIFKHYPKEIGILTYRLTTGQ